MGKEAVNIHEQAIKMYDEDNDYGAMLEVDVEYPPMVRVKHKNLPFLPHRQKINKVNKFVTTIDDKEKKNMLQLLMMKYINLLQLLTIKKNT